jgi:uncharacterized protein (DUF1778 family)
VLTESTLNATSFKAFLKALSGPATPVPELVEALERPAPWEAAGLQRR